jgi:acetylornithine deacetylase/succinyl-diaminopimelate desuccinylase-like protein
VPERFVVRFDRRLTWGETPEDALADVEGMDAVRQARAAGLGVEIRVPRYRQPTWRGYVPDQPQIYPGWLTPEEHPVIEAAIETWNAVAEPAVAADAAGGGLRKKPRVDRWIFSTDGVGWPVPPDAGGIVIPDRKRWIETDTSRHPAMFGLGTGIEQNTHKIGEALDTRELVHAIAFLARYSVALARQP